MRNKLFLGSFVLLFVGAIAFAGAYTMVTATSTPEPTQAVQSASQGQPCCTENECCLECILCCSIDGGCEECFQCCIEMGCDPFCCLPNSTSTKAEAPKAKTCSGVGCCK